MTTVRQLTRHAEFMELKDAWNAMPQAMQSPLARHEWFAAARDAFAMNNALAIFVVERNSEVCAIAPLVVERTKGRAQLTILGHQTHEPSGFLYKDEAALADLCAAVLRDRRPAVLPRFAAAADEMRVLGESRKRGLLAVRQAPLRTSRVPLGDWKTVEAAMSASSRSFMRRKWKATQSASNGPVRAEVIVPDALNVERYLNELYRIEHSGWKRQAGTSILSDKGLEAFYTTLAREAARQGIARFYFLHAGDQIIAARLAVAYGGRLWDLKIGYDEQWRNSAPGILLTHETLRLACEEGLNAHEFLGGYEAWQDRWPLEIEERTTARFYPLSVFGGMSLGADLFRFGGDRVRAAFSSNAILASPAGSVISSSAGTLIAAV